jgi:hypothetical protein
MTHSKESEPSLSLKFGKIARLAVLLELGGSLIDPAHP